MAIKVAKNYRNYSLKVKIEKGIRFNRRRNIEAKTIFDLEGTVPINQTIVSGIIFKLFNQNRNIIIIKDNYYYYGEFELIEKYCKILLLEKK